MKISRYFLSLPGEGRAHSALAQIGSDNLNLHNLAFFSHYLTAFESKKAQSAGFSFNSKLESHLSSAGLAKLISAKFVLSDVCVAVALRGCSKRRCAE